MTIAVFFVNGFFEPAVDSQQTLGITVRYEFQLAAQRFLKGQLSGAIIEQYSFDVIVII
jgi:hypothetical protein